MARFLRFSLAATLLAVAGAAGAEQPLERVPVAEETPAYRIQLLFENDGSFLKPNELEDRHYTNGAALDIAARSETLGGWIEGLGLPVEGAAAGLFIAHEIYTPENLSTRDPDPADRPYAGYLYGGLYAQREAGDWLDHLQLNLGVVGPSSLAEPVQVFIHDNFNGDDPLGWDTQLDDEFAANAVYRRTLRLDAAAWTGGSLGPAHLRPGGWNAQLLPYGEVRVGTTHRDATVGTLLRLGWKLPDDFGPAQVRDPGSFTGAGPQRGWSAYAFAGAAARYVEWNTFLEGNYARDPSPAVEPEPFIGLFRGGLAIAYRGEAFTAELSYAQAYRTREFEGQRDANGIGQIAATLSWGF